MPLRSKVWSATRRAVEPVDGCIEDGACLGGPHPRQLFDKRLEILLVAEHQARAELTLTPTICVRPSLPRKSHALPREPLRRVGRHRGMADLA
jgi:hypothetical protein